MNRYAVAAVAALLTIAAAPVLGAPSAAIMAAVADPTRPESDRAVDAVRKPAETLDFAGVKAGQKIAELWPGSPYFRRLLARAVGDGGNIYPVTGNYRDFDLPKDLDMVLSVRNYHGFQSAMTDLRPFNKRIFAAMKPGGVYLVIDYAAFWDAQPYVGPILNRSREAVVRDEVQAAGFLYVGASDILRNPVDDKSKPVPRNELGGTADQYILKFVKP